GPLIDRSDRHAALTIVRYKEFWADQGANNDVVDVNGVNIINAANSPLTKRVNAIFVFDNGSDGVTNLTTPIARPFALPFITGVALFLPVPTPPNDPISVAVTPRLGGGHTEVVNVPNWASSTDPVSIQLRDDD